MLIAVAAVSNNGFIGSDNQIPWHIPNDLKRFKNLTSGGTVIMGRKTYESIGRPLPNRRNVVLTRNDNFRPDGVTVYNDFNELVKEEQILTCSDQKKFVIGGSEIYELFAPLCKTLKITHVHQDVDGDATFPITLHANMWELSSSEYSEEDGCTYSTYERVTKA